MGDPISKAQNGNKPTMASLPLDCDRATPNESVCTAIFIGIPQLSR